MKGTDGVATLQSETILVCIKVLSKKVKDMEWVLEKKAKSIDNPESFDKLKKSYEQALENLQAVGIATSS